ncbi:hypothetical protein FQR65_LT15993 [Abscondita terminalis]|nr:hypothetical protein FQR65_LT15993 [Abscondita terminalis]
MGRVCERNKQGKGNRTLSRPRKNRRLLTLQLLKQKKANKNTENRPETTPMNVDHDDIHPQVCVMEHDDNNTASTSQKEHKSLTDVAHDNDCENVSIVQPNTIVNDQASTSNTMHCQRILLTKSQWKSTVHRGPVSERCSSCHLGINSFSITCHCCKITTVGEIVAEENWMDLNNHLEPEAEFLNKDFSAPNMVHTISEPKNGHRDELKPVKYNNVYHCNQLKDGKNVCSQCCKITTVGEIVAEENWMDLNNHLEPEAEFLNKRLFCTKYGSLQSVNQRMGIGMS